MMGEAIAARLAHGDAAEIWLVLAVMERELPTRDHLASVMRSLALDGRLRVARRIVRKRDTFRPWKWFARRTVRVVSGVLVDVHHTATTDLATGIQRVARNVAREWSLSHSATLVRWGAHGRCLRTLTDSETRRVTGNDATPREGHTRPTMVVPWHGTYVLPELAIDEPRAARIGALADHSPNFCGAIGFDCVPITSPETVAPGMGGVFARYLSALSNFDVIVPISEAARDEYDGWRSMLSGAGLAGPEVREVSLPAVAGTPESLDFTQARDLLLTDDRPLVLCVGSHEPRKNHMAVLQAAELLWRQGHKFSLAFIGGNAWSAKPFLARVEALRSSGRPITIASTTPDSVLWAAYSIAVCTVFPSLNEGFGLPVAESLAIGTPVVTSNFGSMREIAAGGGAILVDPRNDEDIARGISQILTDPALRARLAEQAGSRPQQTWAEYSEAVWRHLFPVE